ncbi:hypothetical protein [Roseicyclus sp.]|uniref:hypothetical protein n=1 Tax=Roseicyclus sp. TaxID=1914329 RepID=UPI003F9FBF21
MQLEVALVSSLACLALVAAIYSCNILSAPRSRLRGEMLAMILLSLLVSVFPIALAATGVVAWQVVAGSGETSIVVAAIVLPVSAAAVAATILVFRALVRATYRGSSVPTNVTPLAPQPKTPPASPRVSRDSA